MLEIEKKTDNDSDTDIKVDLGQQPEGVGESNSISGGD